MADERSMIDLATQLRFIYMSASVKPTVLVLEHLIPGQVLTDSVFAQELQCPDPSLKKIMKVLLARGARTLERYGQATADQVYFKAMLLALIPADFFGYDVISLLTAAVQVRKLTLQGLNEFYKVT
jgi:hypothetical protein